MDYSPQLHTKSCYDEQILLQIDYLSSLPPELLLSIFDLAYDPHQLLLEPLSKRLLPYFRRNLYRQIRITSDTSWSDLLATVEDSPALGELVIDLDTSGYFSESQPGTFGEIIKPFPRLKSVKTGYIRSLRKLASNNVLPPLEYMSYERDSPDIQSLSTFSRSNLITLEINFCSIKLVPAPALLPRLQSVKEIALVGKRRCDGDPTDIRWVGLVQLIACCPDITSLRLFDPDYPDYQGLLSQASSFLSRITSLELDSLRLPDVYEICCDHLLPRFSNLTHLTSGDGTPSASLPTYLRQLPLLISLRLGPDAHWNLVATDFFTLLEGSARHPSLQRLSFECFGGRTGRRMGVNDGVTLEDYLGMEKDDWQRPTFCEEFGKHDASELRRICTANQIHLEGFDNSISDLEADFDLEFANRSVLRCLQLKTLDSLTSDDGSPVFAHISIDDLDPRNLKLVKTEIPEKNWFRLSLE